METIKKPAVVPQTMLQTVRNITDNKSERQLIPSGFRMGVFVSDMTIDSPHILQSKEPYARGTRISNVKVLVVLVLFRSYITDGERRHARTPSPSLNT